MDFTGNYTYNFYKIEPRWNNRLETGVSSVVVGLFCDFSGSYDDGEAIRHSSSIDGRIPFTPPITYDSLTGNIHTLMNEYASGNNWFSSLENQIENMIINTSSPVRNFPFVGLESIVVKKIKEEKELGAEKSPMFLVNSKIDRIEKNKKGEKETFLRPDKELRKSKESFGKGDIDPR